MTRKIEDFPENENPSEFDWIIGSPFTTPNSFQKTKVSDLLKNSNSGGGNTTEPIIDDADAINYFAKFDNGILSIKGKDATQTLVKDLKVENLWTNLSVLWLMHGKTANDLKKCVRGADIDISASTIRPVKYGFSTTTATANFLDFAPGTTNHTIGWYLSSIRQEGFETALYTGNANANGIGFGTDTQNSFPLRGGLAFGAARYHDRMPGFAANSNIFGGALIPYHGRTLLNSTSGNWTNQGTAKTSATLRYPTIAQVVFCYARALTIIELKTLEFIIANYINNCERH